MSLSPRLLKSAVALALLFGLVAGWRQLGKPGLIVFQQLGSDISMSLPWRDFVFSRKPLASGVLLLPKAVEIPLATFVYGCLPGRDVAPDDRCPQNEAARTVDLRALPRPCTAMGVFEVTYDEYDYYVWSQRHLPSGQRPPYPEAPHGVRGFSPVVNVSHGDALGYVRWLSQATRQTWRLPTEEEWEYAARGIHPSKPGGKEGSWWWGNESPTINGRADCNGCDTRSDGGSSQVGSFKPNPFGIHDSVGNVSEWTSSPYTVDNRAAALDAADAPRARRGGSWSDAGDDTRVSGRRYSLPDLRYSLIGFCVCRE